VNNAVARTASLVAVAVLPLVAGLSAHAYTDPTALTAAFHTAMLITGLLICLGAAIGAVGIVNPERSSDR